MPSLKSFSSSSLTVMSSSSNSSKNGSPNNTVYVDFRKRMKTECGLISVESNEKSNTVAMETCTSFANARPGGVAFGHTSSKN